MIRSLAILLACQLLGEAAARGLGLPVPGPVIGLVLLASALAWLGGAGPDLTATASGLLKNLSLLFVPAGVGVVQQAGLLAERAVALGLALVISTVATIAVTAIVFDRVVRRLAQGKEETR